MTRTPSEPDAAASPTEFYYRTLPLNDPENKGNRTFRNSRNYLPVNTALRHRALVSSAAEFACFRKFLAPGLQFQRLETAHNLSTASFKAKLKTALPAAQMLQEAVTVIRHRHKDALTGVLE